MLKKIFFFSLLQILCTTIFAQNEPEFIQYLRDSINKTSDRFLTVKGVELRPGLKMKDLLEKFEDKGFSKTKNFSSYYDESAVYSLTGDFFRHSGCLINLIPTQRDKSIVGIVAIAFPFNDSYPQLISTYDELKKALLKKYFLTECIEKFNDNGIKESNSDFLKLRALSEGEATYRTTFVLSNDQHSMLFGCIILSINHAAVDYKTNNFVSLFYYTFDKMIEEFIPDDDL